MKPSWRTSPLLLAILLQASPFWRAMTIDLSVPSGFGMAMIRQLILFTGVIGSIDALSGATGPAVIPKTYHGKVGQAANFVIDIQNDFSYIIDTISWAPISPPGKLPPGLNLVSNQISIDPLIVSGSIEGKPTVAGTYQVLVTIGDSHSLDFFISGTNTLVIAPGDIPATITTPPTNQVVGQGTNVTFSVVAAGSTPIFYQWYYGGNTQIVGATNATLTLTNVPLTAAGTYSVSVTNAFGGQTSSAAKLTVNPKVVVPPFALANEHEVGGQFQFEFPTVIGASYSVQFLSALHGSTWQTVTNFPTATSAGPAQFMTPSNRAQGWYRVTSVP